MCETIKGEPRVFAETYEKMAKLMGVIDKSGNKIVSSGSREVPGAREEAALKLSGDIYSFKLEQRKNRDLPRGALSGKH